MSFFTKKNFLYKLIICLCIILAIMNFSGTNNVYATDDDTGIGGVLMNPICELLLGLGDAIMNIIQNSIMGTDATVSIDKTKETDWGTIILGMIIIAVAFVATVITAGGFAAACAAITLTVAKAALIFGVVTIATGGFDGMVWGAVTAVADEALNDTVVFPLYTIGPEEIFSGKVLLFDANIFNPKQVYVKYNVIDIETEEVVSTGATVTLESWEELKNDSQNQVVEYYYETDDGEHVVTSVNNSAQELRNVISKWYYIIRNIALVGSMLILIYIGIRIIISSVAEEKAKYKQMLGDWLVALCLIVVMHYIMIFAHSVVSEIGNLFDNAIDDKMNFAVIQDPSDKLIEGVQELEESSGNQYYYEDEKLIKWPTNQMGRFRVKAQSKDGSDKYIGYSLAYFVLVLYTLVFSFTYIKRLIYLLFLTVIAPLVALTYPIDKIHDGKAQAFNMWLKEYIFNLLIQPFHLLLYTIFVTMAFDLASKNIIYTLVVLGFMIPAEKLLRTMFGFNKASTPGLFAGATGAALTMSAVKSLGNFAKGHGGGKPSSGAQSKEKEEANRIRTPDSEHSQDNLFEELANEGSNTNPIPNTHDADSESQHSDGAESGGHELPEGEQENSEQSQQPVQPEQQEIPMQPEQPERPMQPEKPIQPKQSEKKGETKPKSRAKATLKIAGKMAGQTLKAVPGTALRLGLNAAAATAMGSIGLASGIVSGDVNTAFRNTTAGVTAGVALSKGTANRISNSINANKDKAIQIKEQWEREAYGEDYGKHMREKADKAFMKDKEIRRLYRQQLGLKDKKQVNAAMEDAQKYRDWGVNDNSIIIKAMKSDNGNTENRADTRRIAAARIAEKAKTEKDLETHMKRLEKTPGIRDGQVKDIESLVRGINDL